MSSTSARTGKRKRHALSPEERAQRLSQARQQLLDGVDALMTSDGWQQLVASRAWLSRYSLNNLIMILRQCPEATDVRPHSEWRKLGYPYVRKGTHKIKIWKPCFRTVDTETEDDPQGAETGEKREVASLTRFMLVPVVDVSQLQGNPPTASPQWPAALTGDAPAGLWDGVAMQVAERGFTVERDDCDAAMGRTLWDERRVIVRPDVEPAQAAKTLTHELAHILCDHESRSSAPRPLREVEAESVACIVAATCGLDTLAYSVPYVSGWAGDRETVRTSAQRVLTVADAILDRLDGMAADSVVADGGSASDL